MAGREPASRVTVGVPRIKRLTERRDADGNLITVACCVCFRMVKVRDLFVDKSGQKWDVCSSNHAHKAGIE